MKYINEYRDKELITKLANQIRTIASGNYTFMEVCGGHTAAIHRFGIPSLLPDNISLISGPGCPVCVTGTDFIDRTIAYSAMDDIIITTFGDLVRVPGTFSSLEKERSSGSDIRIVFSGLEALNIARSNPDKKVIFLGIGFETTAPGTAVTIMEAQKAGIDNFFVLSAHKIMPPAMEAIMKDEVQLDGFICPGHVAAITGSDYFRFIPERHKLACVISGFEPSDILQSVLMLVNQVNNGSPVPEIQYKRVVTREGNLLAREAMNEVFEPTNTLWRGLGMIPASGLGLRDEFGNFNVEKKIAVRVISGKENPACICGDILRGVRIPDDCSLFGSVCNPENPVGACMVSGEGACNSFYRYRLND
jgi:hydrogenase expression/formation protein HypD